MLWRCGGKRLTGLEPHGLSRAGLVQLGHNAAQGTEHGPASVDDLQGAVPGHVH